jgi:hypothetical protein
MTINLLDGLVSYWDGSYSSSTAFDLTSNNNGTANNIRVFGTDGKIGKGFDFTAGNDSININGVTSSIDINNCTISFWIKGSAQSNTNYFFSTGNSANTDNYFGIHATSSTLYRVILRQNTQFRILEVSSTVVLNDSWNHIVFVNNNRSWVTYVNGIEDISGTYVQTNFSHNQARIGSRFIQSTESLFLNGLIDELCIWNRGLSLDEAKHLYDIQKDGSPSGQYPFPTGYTSPFPSFRRRTT